VQFDLDFYERLAQLSGNVVLSLMFNTVRPPFFMFKPVFVDLVPSVEAMFKTQQDVITAMLDGDEALAVRRTAEWLELGAQKLLGTGAKPGPDLDRADRPE
jgi:DNA-binding FadR family transcriptional regulator